MKQSVATKKNKRREQQMRLLKHGPGYKKKNKYFIRFIIESLQQTIKTYSVTKKKKTHIDKSFIFISSKYDDMYL